MFLLNELERSATPKLFASFINETSGWILYGNVLQKMGIAIYTEEINGKLKK